MNQVIFFVKYPAAGEVKTRLAAAVGPERAAALYRNMAESVLRSAFPEKNSSYLLEVCFAPGEREKLFRRWLPAAETFYPQEGVSLGERMRSAVERSLRAGFSKTILIGSDCPAVNRDLIEEGFGLLDAHDVVLGPAADGGYYLIGMSMPHSVLFEGIAWGTGLVYEQTLSAASRAGLSSAALPVLRDIDRAEDLACYPDLVGYDT